MSPCTLRPSAPSSFRCVRAGAGLSTTAQPLESNLELGERKDCPRGSPPTALTDPQLAKRARGPG